MPTEFTLEDFGTSPPDEFKLEDFGEPKPVIRVPKEALDAYSGTMRILPPGMPFMPNAVLEVPRPKSVTTPLVPFPKAAPVEEVEPSTTEKVMAGTSALTAPVLVGEKAGIVAPNTATQINRELFNLAVSLPEFFSSPAGIATPVAAEIAPTLVAAGFTADMARNLYQEAKQTYANWDQMTGPQKAASLVRMTGTGLLGTLLAKSTVKGIRDWRAERAPVQGPIPTGEVLRTPEGAVPPPPPIGPPSPTFEQIMGMKVAERSKRIAAEKPAGVVPPVAPVEAPPGTMLPVPRPEPVAPKPAAPVEAKPAPVARDWDSFYEDLIGNLDSFAPARSTGVRNYDLNDMAQRFVDFAKADTSGKSPLELVKDFAKSDEASTSQIRKLRAALKDLESKPAPAVEEGKPSPTAEAVAPAVEKVEKQVEKVARTEGMRPAKEVKDELISRVEQAIQDAPSINDEKPADWKPKITISIPKDGDFTVFNDKESLTKFLASVKSIRTSPTEWSRVSVRPDMTAEGILRKDVNDAITVYGDEANAYRRLLNQIDQAKDLELPPPQLNRLKKLVGRLYEHLYGPWEKAAQEFVYLQSRIKGALRKLSPQDPDVKDLQLRLAAAQKEMARNASELTSKGLSVPSVKAESLVQPPPPAAPETKGQPPIIGMGGAAKGEMGEPGDFVSNMFAVIDTDRAAVGKPPMPPGKTRSWSQDETIALDKMNHDPDWVPTLIQSVLKQPRPLLSWEHASILFQKAKWKAEANNALRRLAEATDSGRAADAAEAKLDVARFEDNLNDLETAVGRGGTGSEAGRSLQAQKMGLTDDLTLVEMRMGIRGAKGGERLTPEEEKWVQDLFNRNLKLDQQLAALTEQKTKLAADLELAKLKATTPVGSQIPEIIVKTAEKIVATLDKKADAARARLKGKLLSPSPQDMLDLAEIAASHIAHVGLDFTKFSVKMVGEFGDRIKPYLNQLFKMGQETIDRFNVSEPVKRRVKAITPEDQKRELVQAVKDKVEKKKNDEIAHQVRKLARVLYEEGIHEREAMVDALHGLLQDVIPNWSRRQTMDAFSGYGDFKQLSKDQITVALRGMKGELQQIAKLEDMAAGTPPLKSGLERRTPTEAERQLIKLVNDAKYKFQVPISDPNTQLKSALDTLKTTLRNRILDYQDRLARQDFTTRPRRELVKDREVLQLEADKERIRREYQRGKLKYELAQRKWWQKFGDAFVKWERAFKLSSPVVFGKLGAAAMTRAVTTATEEVTGTGIGLVPGISKVAARAPREGGINVKAMAHAMTEAITVGMRDAAETARTGMTSLDVLLGEKGGMDPDWANVFGQLHGMMKAPIKRAEYTLSLEKRIEWNIKQGVDVTDPFVQTRLMTEALNDGYRTIFMQLGFTSDWFTAAVRMAEQNKKFPVAGYWAARATRFLLPIIRVPINIVSETATGAHGFVTASARTMYHAMNGGLENLPPEVADSIMRQFKKGAIGAGLMAIGYFNPQFAGGYDWREKRKPGTVKTGGFQVFGMNVPRWMTHAPWFELMQIGATIRHVKDQHVKGEDRGISEGMWAAAFGLLEQTPFYGQMIRLARASEGTSVRERWGGEMLLSTVVPQAIQKIAQLTDKDVQRKPRNIWEHIAMGIPGLRQQVPVKTDKTKTSRF